MGEYSDFSKSIDQYLNRQAILNARPLDKNTNIENKNNPYTNFLDLSVFSLTGHRQIQVNTFLEVAIGSIAAVDNETNGL